MVLISSKQGFCKVIQILSKNSTLNLNNKSQIIYTPRCQAETTFRLIKSA